MPESNVPANTNPTPEVPADLHMDIDRAEAGPDQVPETPAAHLEVGGTDIVADSKGTESESSGVAASLERPGEKESKIGWGKKTIAAFVAAGVAGVGAAVVGVNAFGQSANQPPASTSASSTPGNPGGTSTSTESNTPPSSPETTKTPTPTTPEWTPSRGNVLKHPTRLTEEQLIEACTIFEDDPDAQTAEGIVKKYSYTVNSLIRNGFDAEQLVNQYGTDDGQITPEAADKYAKDVAARLNGCLGYMFNDGNSYTMKAIEFGLSINANRESAAELDPSVYDTTELYQVHSRLIESSLKYDKETGKVSFVTEETSNFDKSYGKVVSDYNPENPRYTDLNPCRTSVSFRIKWQDGVLVFADYTAKAICEKDSK